MTQLVRMYRLCLQQFLLAAFCDSLGQLRQQAALSNAVVSASELLLLEQLAQQPSNKSNAYISRGSLQARQQIGTTPSTHPSADALHAQAKSASSACSSNSGTSDTPDELHGEDETDRDAGEAAADWDDEGSIPAAPAGDPLHLMKLCLSLVCGHSSNCIGAAIPTHRSYMLPIVAAVGIHGHGGTCHRLPPAADMLLLNAHSQSDGDRPSALLIPRAHVVKVDQQSLYSAAPNCMLQAEDSSAESPTLRELLAAAGQVSDHPVSLHLLLMSRCLTCSRALRASMVVVLQLPCKDA